MICSLILSEISSFWGYLSFPKFCFTLSWLVCQFPSLLSFLFKPNLWTTSPDSITVHPPLSCLMLRTDRSWPTVHLRNYVFAWKLLRNLSEFCCSSGEFSPLTVLPLSSVCVSASPLCPRPGVEKLVLYFNDTAWYGSNFFFLSSSPLPPCSDSSLSPDPLRPIWQRKFCCFLCAKIG